MQNKVEIKHMKATDRSDYGEGSVYQRKDGTWTARFYLGGGENGKGKVKAFYGKTEKEVKRKLNAFKKEYHKNDFVSVQKTTVADFMTTWLEEKKVNELKPKSYDRLEQTIKNDVIPYIGWIQIAAIKSADVQKMLNDLKEKGLSYSTIKKAYEAVNACFKNGVIRDLVVKNPALGVAVPMKKTFEKVSKLKYYTPEEKIQLCGAATAMYKSMKLKHRLGFGFILDLNTGLRMAELIGLKWEDIDFEKKILRVNSTRVIVKDRSENAKTHYKVIEQEDSAKTAAGLRYIDLNDEAMMALRILKVQNGKSDYVLATEDGLPVTPGNIDKSFRSVLREAGFPKEKIYGLHSLRHTFASMLFAKNVDVKTVSELLGHADVKVTYDTYIHLINGQKKKAVKAISKTADTK